MFELLSRSSRRWHGGNRRWRPAPVRIVVLARDLKVTVWQWPQPWTIWAKQLPKSSQAEVVAVEPVGTMICRLQKDGYFVLWLQSDSEAGGLDGKVLDSLLKV